VGRGPVSLNVGAGYPAVTVTWYDPGEPKVKLFPLLPVAGIVGAWFTIKVAVAAVPLGALVALIAPVELV